ncbi:MAG: TIGR01777 family oxidoreductase [Desulfovibrionales bacterium]
MHYFVMGGTGFVGTALLEHLQAKGHRVSALVREGSSLKVGGKGIEAVPGNAMKEGEWQKVAAEADVVVNLVGASIFRRWTEDAKKKITTTRVVSTRRAVQAMRKTGGQTFVCANAVGFYGDRGDEILVEESGPGQGFLAEVCKQWQQEAREAESKGHRVVLARFAPVLGKGGGVMGQMLPVFKLGLGGPLGSGKQWFAWVHMTDLVRAIEFAGENHEITGPVNVCSPHPVTNKDFTGSLAAKLHRPAFFKVPAVVLKTALGEAATMVLDSVRCVPGKLQSSGFSFKYPRLEQALDEILK